jgi:hypothetical protein
MSYTVYKNPRKFEVILNLLGKATYKQTDHKICNEMGRKKSAKFIGKGVSWNYLATLIQPVKMVAPWASEMDLAESAFCTIIWSAHQYLRAEITVWKTNPLMALGKKLLLYVTQWDISYFPTTDNRLRSLGGILRPISGKTETLSWCQNLLPCKSNNRLDKDYVEVLEGKATWHLKFGCRKILWPMVSGNKNRCVVQHKPFFFSFGDFLRRRHVAFPSTIVKYSLGFRIM